MRSRAIRKRIDRIAAILEKVQQQSSISSVALELAQALTPEQLRALERRLTNNPGAELADVVTDVEMAGLLAKVVETR